MSTTEKINGHTAQEWLEKYLDTENRWLVDGYYQEPLVHNVMKQCAILGRPVPQMYETLTASLLVAYRACRDRRMELAAGAPMVMISPSNSDPKIS